MGKKSKKAPRVALDQTVTVVVGEMVSDVPVSMSCDMTPDGLRAVYSQGLREFNETKSMNLAMEDFSLRPDPVSISDHPTTWKAYDKTFGFVTMVLRTQPLHFSQESLNVIDSERLAVGMSLVEEKPLKKSNGNELDDLRQMMERLQTDSQEQKSAIIGLVSDMQDQKSINARLISDMQDQKSSIDYLMKRSVVHDTILRRKLIFEIEKKIQASETSISSLSSDAVSLLTAEKQPSHCVAHKMGFEDMENIAAAVTSTQKNHDAWEELFFAQFSQSADSIIFPES